MNINVSFICACLFVLSVSCCQDINNKEDGKGAKITVENNSKLDTSCAVRAAWILIEGGANPDEIYLEGGSPNKSIRLSTADGSDPGGVFLLFNDPDLYQGQVVILKDQSRTKSYSGTDMKLYCFVVGERVAFNNLIETVKSYGDIDYVICDYSAYKKSKFFMSKNPSVAP